MGVWSLFLGTLKAQSVLIYLGKYDESKTDGRLASGPNSVIHLYDSMEGKCEKTYKRVRQEFSRKQLRNILQDKMWARDNNAPAPKRPNIPSFFHHCFSRRHSKRSRSTSIRQIYLFLVRTSGYLVQDRPPLSSSDVNLAAVPGIPHGSRTGRRSLPKYSTESLPPIYYVLATSLGNGQSQTIT